MSKGQESQGLLNQTIAALPENDWSDQYAVIRIMQASSYLSSEPLKHELTSVSCMESYCRMIMFYISQSPHSAQKVMTYIWWIVVEWWIINQVSSFFTLSKHVSYRHLWTHEHTTETSPTIARPEHVWFSCCEWGRCGTCALNTVSLFVQCAMTHWAVEFEISRGVIPSHADHERGYLEMDFFQTNPKNTLNSHSFEAVPLPLSLAGWLSTPSSPLTDAGTFCWPGELASEGGKSEFCLFLPFS